MAVSRVHTSGEPQTAKASPARKTARGAAAPEDNMTQCVALCQELRWREATILCRRMCARAKSDGNTELLESLSAAQLKIEYSLRRQMAAALTRSVKDLLEKEYLLDVGQ